MLKKFISNKKKSHLISIIIITTLISIILTYVSPETKIYRVKYTLSFSENVLYQKLLYSKELDIDKLQIEVREQIHFLNNGTVNNFNNGCFKMWKKNTYDVYKYSNSIIIEFETDINKLEEINKCYNAIEIQIEKLNKKIIRLVRFIYAEKIYYNKNQLIDNKENIKFFDDLETFNKEQFIRINENFYILTKDFYQKENYFDKKINKFISYFIILFIFLLFLTNFKIIIYKIKQFKL
jgi:hypothetical protein